MQFKSIITQKLPFFVALGLATVLTSCGSFQYAGYDNDGIYSSNEYEETPQETVVTTSTNDSNYYKNYFAQNSAEIEAIKEESDVFTDIDSYEGDYTEQAIDSLEQRPAYGGWGQNTNTVTINYIDNGWYGYNDPWFWNGGFGYGYYGWAQPWGWNNWGWNSWGWNNYWAYGGYYGYGYYSPWNYGYGYNNWGWNNSYYRHNNRYAYSNSRRGSLLYNDNLTRNSRSNSAISRRNYSTSRLSNSSSTNRSSTVRSSSPTNTVRSTRTGTSRSTIRTTRPNTNIRTTRPSTTRSTRSTRSNTRTSTPSRSTRSSGTVRSSSSSSRSSGSVRSSSSSSRSSSSSSSSSRRGRG